MNLEPNIHPERYREKRGWYVGFKIKMTGQEALTLIRTAITKAKQLYARHALRSADSPPDPAPPDRGNH